MKAEFRRPTPVSGLLKLSRALHLLMLVGICALSGCSYNMSKQPRYKPMSPSNFFEDQRSERPVVQGTVATHQDPAGPAITGKENGTDIAKAPVPVTMDLLNRGRRQFDIYCSPCHSRVGNGEGMIVQRGFVQPPTFHSDRLRQEPDGHYFAVMTEGFGRMYSYANRVGVSDRWAITSYVRALQLSQSTAIEDVPKDQRQKLLGAPK